MSTRDYMLAVKSVEPIRAVVGSKDQALFDAILAVTKESLDEEYGPADDLDEDSLEEYQEQLEETKTHAAQMILDAKPPRAEPGCWVYLIREVIRIKELEEPISLQFNKGYKHVYAWEPYRKLVQSRLTKAALESLRHLEDGRPLRGNAIDYDGSLFAWLTQAEIATLHDSLSKIEANEVGNPDLVEFHQDLVEALELLRESGCELVLSAH